MPIIWKNGPNAGRVLHEGRVLSFGSRTVRIMSDVWESEDYAEVWDGSRVVDVLLEDWGYPLREGEWTKNYAEAPDSSRMDRFRAEARVDAGEDVLAEVGAWRELNFLVESTRRRLREASHIGLHKEVEVVKGRKVPIGTVCEVTSRIIEGDYGRTVHLRDQKGQAYSYVSIQNLRVVRPERYAEGEVACSCCRLRFASATEAGMVSKAWADGICRACRLDNTLDGHGDIDLPAASLHFEPFRGYAPLRGTGAEPLLRAVFDEPEDILRWMVLCDWLEENGDARAEGLRTALAGKPKTKRTRKKS